MIDLHFMFIDLHHYNNKLILSIHYVLMYRV